MQRAFQIAALLTPLALLGVADGDPDRFDTVVLDAGHGGDDAGARSIRGRTEKDIVLDVTRRLATRLRQQGLRVILTRDRDAFVPLEERTAIANDARADLFISIHVNAARSRQARGIETYFLSLQPSDETSKELARRENAAFGSGEGPAAAAEDPLLSVLGDMMETEHRMESDEFSRLVHAKLHGLRAAPGRGVKQAPFVVLMGLQMPASLLEIGFITNPEDARWLAVPKHRDQIADAIVKAVQEFGRRYDARRGRGMVRGGG